MTVPTRCRNCKRPVLAIRTPYMDRVPVEVNQIPIGAHLEGYEHHPLFGWNSVSADIGFQRRGHPVHAAHQCESEGETK